MPLMWEGESLTNGTKWRRGVGRVVTFVISLRYDSLSFSQLLKVLRKCLNAARNYGNALVDNLCMQNPYFSALRERRTTFRITNLECMQFPFFLALQMSITSNCPRRRCTKEKKRKWRKEKWKPTRLEKEGCLGNGGLSLTFQWFHASLLLWWKCQQKPQQERGTEGKNNKTRSKAEIKSVKPKKHFIPFSLSLLFVNNKIHKSAQDARSQWAPVFTLSWLLYEGK